MLRCAWVIPAAQYKQKHNCCILYKQMFLSIFTYVICVFFFFFQRYLHADLMSSSVVMAPAFMAPNSVIKFTTVQTTVTRPAVSTVSVALAQRKADKQVTWNRTKSSRSFF